MLRTGRSCSWVQNPTVSYLLRRMKLSLGTLQHHDCFLTESRNRRERSNYQTRGGGTEAKGAKGVCRHLLFLRPGREYAHFRWRNFRWRSFRWWKLSVTKLSVMKLSVQRCAMECQEKMLSLCWANSLTKFLWRMLLMSNWSTWPLSL